MTAKLTEALCGFYADVATIHKDSKGNFGKYADLATVLSAVIPALAKNGLAVVQTFDSTEAGDQLLITTLLHSSGDKITSALPLTISKGRNPLHDWGGAVSYQRRYALLAILNLAAGIEDDDGDSATTAPAPAAKQAPAQPPVTAKKNDTPAQPSAPAAKTEAQRTKKEVVFLSDEQVADLKAQVKALHPDARSALVAGFKSQFEIPEGVATIADRIQFPEHAAFITNFIQSLPDP